MNNIGLILFTLYPNAEIGDYLVQDDGAGPYIARWDEAKLGPQPTEAELLAAEVGALRKAEARKKIAEAEARITPRRLREAILSGDKSWLTAREAEIAAERAKLS